MREQGGGRLPDVPMAPFEPIAPEFEASPEGRVKGPLLDRMNQVATDTVPGPTVSVSPHGSTT